jgi:hypothetical protein
VSQWPQEIGRCACLLPGPLFTGRLACGLRAVEDERRGRFRLRRPRRLARMLAISPWLGARSQTKPKRTVATKTLAPPRRDVRVIGDHTSPATPNIAPMAAPADAPVLAFCGIALLRVLLGGCRQDPCLLKGRMATAGGNRPVSPRRHRLCYNPLKADTRVEFLGETCHPVVSRTL